MFLRKLYSEPKGLFKPKEVIEFKDGVNFIFGKKDEANDPKKSLNGIGKSLLLDCLDFCLLSSTDKNSRPRFYTALKQIEGYVIVLEFEVDKKLYILKRSVDNPLNDIEYGAPTKLNKYSASELKPILCELIFENSSYQGNYKNKWLRKILPFFVKIHQHKKAEFVDPIVYSHQRASVAELNQFHLFLMGIDNTLVCKNYDIQTKLKQKDDAIKEIKKIVQETYKSLDVDKAKNEIDKLHREIRELEKNINNFKLAQEYRDVEVDANKLTAEIKEHWYLNYSDRKKIETYNESIKLDFDIKLRRVVNIYKQIDEGLSKNIKKTLDDAIKFRKQLSTSREDFLSKEIQSLEALINEREKHIELLDNERAKLFDFLSAKRAIKDLSKAFLALDHKRSKCADIEGKVKFYNNLRAEQLELKGEESSLDLAMHDFMNSEELKEKETTFRNVFSEIYNAIYTEHKDKSVFALKFNEGKKTKVDIDISFPAMFSKGKNQGRTLIYDLAILFHATKNNVRCPRFLVHDGIFDGMDKAHLVHLYEYLEGLKTKIRHQYIITLNEEGTLKDNFGNTDMVNPEKIAEEAIAVLTPRNKLLGKDFD